MRFKDLTAKESMLVIILRWAAVISICRFWYGYLGAGVLAKIGIYIIADLFTGAITKWLVLRWSLKDALFNFKKKP